ncbi:MAG: hypothetical protein AAB895_00880 [Patescibacteria group bacterium]
MRRERIFLILGIWVAILPYLGFPYSWKNILFTISGLILVYYSYLIYKENKVVKTPEENTQNQNTEREEEYQQEPYERNTNTDEYGRIRFNE